jgi:hypothetical protein
LISIAWDIDDVLNDFMRNWLDYIKASGECSGSFKYNDLTTNPPHGIFDGELDRYLASLDAFREKSLPGLAPQKKMLEWFEKNGHEYRHIALTAIPRRFAPESASWLMKHFGKWIRSYNFVPSFRANDIIPSYDDDKKGFLTWIGKVDLLIEDNEKNILDAYSLGIKTCMFPRPWNSAKAKGVDQFFIELDETLKSLKQRGNDD